MFLKINYCKFQVCPITVLERALFVFQVVVYSNDQVENG